MDEHERSLREKEIELQEKAQALKERELIFSAWKSVVEVQMHFNDMLMRVRNLALTLLLAVFGAATLSLQYDIYVESFGYNTHIATMLLLAGLAGWIGVGLFDWGYYHRLLIGAVRKSTEIEDAYKNDIIFGITNYIT